MRPVLLLFALCISLYPLQATDPASTVLGETETMWPGINYQIVFFKRLPSDRLLVGVRIIATAKAPAGGTLIGFPTPIPPNANKFDIAAGFYHPQSLSLASSVMQEDATQQQYSVLSPIAPPGKRYRPGEILDTLKPGQNDLLTIQFAIPPPPPPPEPGQASFKQTVSFVFTNAKDSIKKIAIPPADTAPK